jgi:putative FmdB family regulatory protein
MAIYVYECKDCEYQFEVVQRMTEDPLEKCPKCDGRIRRLIQPTAVLTGSSSSPKRKPFSGFS